MVVKLNRNGRQETHKSGLGPVGDGDEIFGILFYDRKAVGELIGEDVGNSSRVKQRVQFIPYNFTSAIFRTRHPLELSASRSFTLVPEAEERRPLNYFLASMASLLSSLPKVCQGRALDCSVVTSYFQE